MIPLASILAATDFSAPARHAAERAALISKETAAALDLFHAADFSALEKMLQLLQQAPDKLQQEVLDAARERLRELAVLLLNHHGVAVGMRVVVGSLLTELSKEIESKAASLLVCGAKGESLIRHLLLGSTAERLLSRAICPVLVVKQAPHDQYRTLLVPVDFSASSPRAIHHARAIAPSAELVLLHAFEVPFEGTLRYASVEDDVINHYRVAARQEAVRRLNALREASGLPPEMVRQVVVHGDPAQRILEQEQEQDCDLIVMGKHGGSKLEEVLIGSSTRQVLSESQGDVLVSV